MKVMVIGSGGREHALAWKLAMSPRVTEVLVAPGNGGTASAARCRNVAVDVDDIDALLALAEREGVDLTVVGPEGPLVRGVVDRFAAAGHRIFGPRKAAAALEGSKAFAKAFMARHRIPTADYAVFDALEPARAYAIARGAPIVIKADGLAAGKGVVVAVTLADALAALDHVFSTPAGARVVIEEFLAGEEASYIVLADGTHALPLATSQDHKRRDDGDAGPNTGGMGAYSPAPVVTPAIEARVLAEVIAPTLAGMAADGAPFTGFLYAGLMISPDGGIKVLEFNARCGDPETQPIMLRLKSDLIALIESALIGTLDSARAEWDPRPALGVVLAAPGYPDAPVTGAPLAIEAAAIPADAMLFHAGTRVGESGLVTAGGRVLTACALGADISAARAVAYRALDAVASDGAFFRRDIGHRALLQR